ncbi:hypothetical protein C9413_18885 [Rhizobium sp. SEMIA 4085]|uniref:Uncharacterized protein n=1 Tax=Rhizobium gallicum bv. gallicum R602sp TaxID=1041138 RepID=A0A0B4WXY9_9HYPH|nr:MULTISPECIES: hypothetical protein [Rhizobium]AJD39836.1 hypothetical protein RGR602_CH00469 [Rhizobium gallicum bv. gallicum R602sp]NNH31488.1 hypothetical protein [Rhizobium sp. SEMIA 4085]
MSKLTLWTRSFHPLENFGAGGLFFEGDNRNFSTSLGVTARIKQSVEIYLTQAKVVGRRAISDPSSNRYIGTYEDYSDPKKQPQAEVRGQVDPYRPDGDQHAQVFLSYRGQNFALPGSQTEGGREFYSGVVPELDVTNSVDIHVDRAAQKMTFSCRMVGDGFPNAESFLLDISQNPLFLVTHRRVGSATGQLAGNRRIAMACSSGRVDFPSDAFGSALEAYFALDYATHVGGPVDLFDEGGVKPSSRESWNQMHERRDARGGRVRRWWLDNDVVWVRGRQGSSMP